MEATPEAINSYRHARWKVILVKGLIESHKACSHKGSPSWYSEQAELLNRLQMAEQELHRFPAHWAATYGDQGSVAGEDLRGEN